MKPTGIIKKIYNREISVYEIQKLHKEAKPFAGGSSAHLILPKKYIGREVIIKVLSLKPFICEVCVETISFEKDFSPYPKLCIICYENRQKKPKPKRKERKQ